MFNMESVIRKFYFMMAVMMVLFGIPSRIGAQDNDAGQKSPERNWELMVGGGAIWGPIYSGAADLKVTPVPLIMASYEMSHLRLFIDMDELGAGLQFGTALPISISAGIGLGQERDNDDLDMLEGSPTITSNFRLFGEFRLRLPLSMQIAARTTYFPISASYDEADREDHDYSGLMFDLTLGHQLMMMPFIVSIRGGCAWMDREYAEATYGVEHPTADLGAFEADAGFHDVHLSTMVQMLFTEHIGIGGRVEGKYLLGDAADSPFTENALQPTFTVLAFYRF